MTDDALSEGLQRIEGEGPSPDFVDGLRQRLTAEALGRPTDGVDPSPGGPSTPSAPSVTVLGTDRTAVAPAPRSRLAVPLTAAAALLVGAFLATLVRSDDSTVQPTTTATEARQVGEAWLQAIVVGDRAGFVELHADDLTTNDTLMGFSRDAGILTDERIGELYFAGFDAFQASAASATVRSDGCRDLRRVEVRCAYTAPIGDSAVYTYTNTVDLVVEDGRIVSLSFMTTTDPADLRSDVDAFFAEEATDDDRACIALGFNTVGCGRLEADFARRYIEFHEAADEPPADG